MAKTTLSGKQITDGSVQRADIDITTVGEALVAKLIQGTGVSLSSTGADAGTGDVTINASDASTGAKGIVQLANNLGGTATSPKVIGITETSGPTALTFGSIADGYALIRSGATVIGQSLSTISIATSGTISSAYDRFGTGSPEGAVTASVGTIYHRTDGGTGTTIYRKESGSGNTGWVATAAGAATYAGLDIQPIKYISGGTAPSSAVADFAGQVLAYASGSFGFSSGTASGNISTANATITNATVTIRKILFSDGYGADVSVGQGLGATSYDQKELAIILANSGGNVSVLQNTAADGFSATCFKDNSGNYTMAIGYGNPSSSGTLPFTDRNYIELCDPDLGGSAPALVIAQTTTYAGAMAYGSHPRILLAESGLLTIHERTGAASFVDNVALFTFDHTLPVLLMGGAHAGGQTKLYGEIQGGDENFAIRLRSFPADGSNASDYFCYSDVLSSNGGHRFRAGGLKASQTIKLNIGNDGVAIYAPASAPSTPVTNSMAVFYLDETNGYLKAKIKTSGGTTATSYLPYNNAGPSVKVFSTGGALLGGSADFNGQLLSTADGAFSFGSATFGTHPGISILNDVMYLKEVQFSVGISSCPAIYTGYLEAARVFGNSTTSEHVFRVYGPTYIDNTVTAQNFSYFLSGATRTISSINTTTNVITTSATHGLAVGDAISILTTGTLPGGMVAVSGTPSRSLGYYVQTVPTSTTLTVSISKNATQLDITSGGTGTLTFQNVATGYSAYVLYSDMDPDPGSFAIGLNRLGFTEFADTVFIATNGFVSTDFPKSIIIAQQQGPNQETHARLLFDGTNHTISMWGWDTTNVSTRGNPAFFVAEDGRVALGSLTAISGARVAFTGGTTTLAPYNIPSGTLKTTAAAGDNEYDGVNFYVSNEANNRAAICAEQMFRLTAAGSNITTIGNFFGSTSNITLVANAYYVIEVECYFLKSTASTVTWTFTNSAAPTSMNVYAEYSPLAGISATGVSDLSAHLYNSTTAAQTLVSGSLTTGVNHYAFFRIVLRNGSGTSLKIQATSTSGSITPGIGSFWKCRRVSASNVGTFAA